MLSYKELVNIDYREFIILYKLALERLHHDILITSFTSNLSMTSEWEQPIQKAVDLLDMVELDFSEQLIKEKEDNKLWDDKNGWKSVEDYKAQMAIIKMKLSGNA